MKFFGALAFGVGIVFAGAVFAEDSAPAPVPAPAPGAVPAPEVPASEITLHNYGVKNPECKAWSNACALCARAADGSTSCSTPGIACTPVDIVCLEPGAQ